MTRALVTGCAGFVGFHVCRRLLSDGMQVLGVDNLDDYYDVNLKKDRLAQIADHPAFCFLPLSLADRGRTLRLFHEQRFEVVIHLAGQAGVRHSLIDPYAYVDSNLAAFVNVIEGCRHAAVRHLLFASSSSVYGEGTRLPASTSQNTDHPLSLYAATKKANELMAHAYAHVYRLPSTALRFFTVYGPWGRPDMAIFLFTRAILAGEPVQVFGNGEMRRDFTYIDDAVESLTRLIDHAPRPNPGCNEERPDPAISSAPFRIFNIGSNNPVDLLTLVALLEAKIGKKAKIEMAPPQPGDVGTTFADVEALAVEIGFKPQTPLETGIERFVAWYRWYFRV